MDLHLIAKIAHSTLAALAIGVFVMRALPLFLKSSTGPQSRVVRLTALQHAVYALLIVSGMLLLYQNALQVQHWFYAKIILFIVVLSASAKAFGKRGQDLQLSLAARRTGVVVAALAFAGLLVLIVWKPSFADNPAGNARGTDNHSSQTRVASGL